MGREEFPDAASEFCFPAYIEPTALHFGAVQNVGLIFRVSAAELPPALTIIIVELRLESL